MRDRPTRRKVACSMRSSSLLVLRRATFLLKEEACALHNRATCCVFRVSSGVSGKLDTV
jgi:hypothetical protein